MGLYASQKYKKKDTVAKYGGRVVDSRKYNEKPSYYGIRLNKNEVLDAVSTQSGLGRYANSCMPANKKRGQCGGNNAKIVVDAKAKRGRVVATKGIQSGEEVYVAYGPGFWR